MMNHHLSRRFLSLMTFPLLGLLTGCATDSSPALQPSDFAQPAPATAAGGQPQPAPPAATPASTPAETPAVPAPAGASADSAAPADAAGQDNPAVRQFLQNLPAPTVVPAAPLNSNLRDMVVDGMVGQVNGQPVYAARILSPLHEQLQRLGQSLSPAAFRKEAAKPIFATLDEIVFNILILGEVERDLTENEQTGLRYMIKERREELVRRWGAGSVVMADLALRDREGKTLDEKVAEIRQQILIQRYLHMKLFPKINVTRKDIERYYNDHPQEYRPQPARTIRLIRAETPAAIAKIEEALASGASFLEAAALSANSYRRDQGGLFAEKVTGDEVFGNESLNAAALSLQAGQTSAKIPVGAAACWVYVETLTQGKERSLREVQVEIEELLRRQRFQQLLTRYRSQVFARGTYNSVTQMGQSILEIAVARYAKAQG